MSFHPAVSRQFRDDRRRDRDGLEFRRDITAQGRNLMVTGFKIDGERARLQRLIQMVVEKCRQLLPIRCRAGFLRQVLEDHASVVGTAEESPIDASHRRAYGPRVPVQSKSEPKAVPKAMPPGRAASVRGLR